jgi:hypothetical protein
MTKTEWVVVAIVWGVAVGLALNLLIQYVLDRRKN